MKAPNSGNSRYWWSKSIHVCASPVWSETVNQKRMWLWLPDCVQGGCAVIRRIRKTDNHRIAQHLSLLWHSKPLNDQQTINSKFYIFLEWSDVPSFSTSFCSQEFSLSQARVTGAHICNRTEAAVEDQFYKIENAKRQKSKPFWEKGNMQTSAKHRANWHIHCRFWRSFNLMGIMYTRRNLPTDTNFWWRHLWTLNTKHYNACCSVDLFVWCLLSMCALQMIRFWQELQETMVGTRYRS